MQLAATSSGGRRPGEIARSYLLAAFALVAALVVASLARTDGAPLAGMLEREAGSHAELPLSFVPNRGQADSDAVRYYAQGPGVAFHFTNDRAAITLSGEERGHALHLRFLGASKYARLVAGDPRPGRFNYIAADRRHANLPTYGALVYRDLWPGIDMVIRGASGSLKYEFRLAAGADPSDIRLAYAGASGLAIADSGALAIGTSLGVLTDTRPRTYQQAAGSRIPVESSFALRGRRAYGFSLGAYDRGRPLVIDPGLVYSTFLGGTGNEGGSSVAVDRQGNAYVVGEIGTNDPVDFPTSRRVPDGWPQRAALLCDQALCGRVTARLFDRDPARYGRRRRRD